jgi:hypothetical protein
MNCTWKVLILRSLYIFAIKYFKVWVVTILQKVIMCKNDFFWFFVFILYFSEFYCIFYGFLKLIWFSKNINKNGNSEKIAAQCYASFGPWTQHCWPSPAMKWPRGRPMSETRRACTPRRRSPRPVHWRRCGDLSRLRWQGVAAPMATRWGPL